MTTEPNRPAQDRRPCRRPTPRRLVRWAWALCLAGGTALAGPPAPVNLRVDDVVAPVGTRATPYFGWFLPPMGPDGRQTAFEVRLAKNRARLEQDLPEGRMRVEGPPARRQNHVVYEGPPLEADTRYFWQVRIRDGQGEWSPFSVPAGFTVGLLRQADWQGASWIRREPRAADDYSLFRRVAVLPAKPVERATAYVAAMHHYELFVQGHSIGRGLAYHYPQHQYYNAWDVTAQVSAGGPTCFAISQHWFGGGQGRPEGASGVILKVIIHYQDGTKAEVSTGPDWKTARAAAWQTEPLVHRRESEGVGYVERIDARQLSERWREPGFDDAGWRPATVIGPQPTAPWTGALTPDLSRITEHEIRPAAVRKLADGAYLVDFGRVYAGKPRIYFSGGAAGAEVAMHGGYVLGPDEQIDRTRNQGTNLDFFAILDGGAFCYEPVEYVGLRYLRIEHAPMVVTAENCHLVVRHAALDENGSDFASSEPTLNAIWRLMKHTLTVSAQEQFVDTPTREKGSFLGDSIWQSTAAMPVFGERVLTRRVLGEFIQSMDQFWSAPADRGRINAVYPNGDGARDIPDNTQTYLVWVWEYYRQTGDRAFLRTHYPHLRAVADYVDRARDEQTGLIADLPGGDGKYLHGIIDWPPPMRFGYDVATKARTVVNCLAWRDFDLLALIARELGEVPDEKLYRERADALAGQIKARLRRADGTYIDGLDAAGRPSGHASQHANMLPLALGLVPAAQREAVVRLVKQQGMSVGMETVAWLIQALGSVDEGEHLIELLTNKDWPGWARCLARGATTTWESWYADTARDDSLSHGWGAIGLRAYTDFILGITPLRPQYEVAQIKPLDFGSRLDFAQGWISTERGPVAVAWQRHGGHYRLEVKLPPNMTAEVFVPAGANPSVRLKMDGALVEGKSSGRYLGLTSVGPGTHVIEREL